MISPTLTAIGSQVLTTTFVKSSRAVIPREFSGERFRLLKDNCWEQ